MSKNKVWALILVIIIVAIAIAWKLWPSINKGRSLVVCSFGGDLTPVYVPHAIREFSVFPIVYC